MIRSITVTNYLDDSLTIDLTSPEKSGLYVKSIEGLGPSKAVINSTEMSANDGSLFNSSRLQDRNIVVSLGFFQANKTIETIRQMTYKYFPIKKKLKLTFELDNKIAYVEGYVESNEPDIFSKEEGTSISIICPNPYFYDKKEQETNFSNTKALFEFPFENNSYREKLIEMGEIIILSENVIYYLGEAETGVLITLHALGEVVNPKIYNNTTREAMEIDTDKLRQLTGSGFTTGDDIIINTIRGSKSVYLRRNGRTTNILNCLNKNASWFQLSQGDNIFSYTTESQSSKMQITILNKIVYEGV